MSEKEFIEKLASGLSAVPEKIDIPTLRLYSKKDAQVRAESYIKQMTKEQVFVGAHLGSQFTGKFTKQIHNERSKYLFAENVSLEVNHLSGGLYLSTGFDSMDNLFEKIEPREVLTKSLNETARHLNINQWVKQKEDIKFERLWQIKAAAVTKDGIESNTVLCRAIGAYRHFVSDIPVLGAASVSIKMAGSNKLDSVSINTRETTDVSSGTEKVVKIEEGMNRIYNQLRSLMGKSETPPYEIAEPSSVKFGYFAYSRRKSQRFLMPVFMATINVKNKDVSQGYVLTVPATNHALLIPHLVGADAPPNSKNR